MTASPLPWSTITTAIRAWVSTSTELPLGQVVWSKGNVPQLARPFAWITRLGGPRDTAPRSQQTFTVPMLERVTVSTVTPDTTYAIGILEGAAGVGGPEPAPIEYQFPSGSTPTATMIRDGLVAAFSGASWPTAMADPEHDDALLIVSTEARPLFTVVPSTGLTVAFVAGGRCHRWYRDIELTFRVQAETDELRPGQDAEDLLARARAALDTDTTRDALRDAGLVVRRAGAPIDLSQVIDTEFVSRTSQDFTFATRTEVVESRPWVRGFARPTTTLTEAV